MEFDDELLALQRQQHICSIYIRSLLFMPCFRSSSFPPQPTIQSQQQQQHCQILTLYVQIKVWQAGRPASFLCGQGQQYQYKHQSPCMYVPTRPILLYTPPCGNTLHLFTTPYNQASQQPTEPSPKSIKSKYTPTDRTLRHACMIRLINHDDGESSTASSPSVSPSSKSERLNRRVFTDDLFVR